MDEGIAGPTCQELDFPEHECSGRWINGLPERSLRAIDAGRGWLDRRRVAFLVERTMRTASSDIRMRASFLAMAGCLFVSVGARRDDESPAGGRVALGRPKSTATGNRASRTVMTRSRRRHPTSPPTRSRCPSPPTLPKPRAQCGSQRGSSSTCSTSCRGGLRARGWRLASTRRAG